MLIPTILHGGPTKAALPSSPTTVARRLTRLPAINQIWVSLVELLCQRISASPSPLKSPAPAMLHGGPTKAALPSSPTTVARRLTLLPAINQIWVSLVEL